MSDILLGRLRGHVRPILDVKYVGNTPYAATVDETNNLRVWDIRILTC